jgi:capsular polysaccharide biosynthesis protein
MNLSIFKLLQLVKTKVRPRLVNFAARLLGNSVYSPVQGDCFLLPWIHQGAGNAMVHMRWDRHGSPVIETRHPKRGLSDLVAFKHLGYHNHIVTYVAEIKDAFVTGSSVGVVTSDRVLLTDLSLEFGEPEIVHGAKRRVFFPKPKILQGRWALLATTGGNSYYHHLVEVLPRVGLLEEAGICLKDMNGVLLNGFDKAFQKESWELLGLDSSKMRFTSRGAYYHCKQLVAPSPIDTPGTLPPSGAAFLKRMFGIAKTVSSPEQLVYVSREYENSRKILNEEDLWLVLKRHGFQKIHCEKMKIQKQARLFSKARMVVGPHGGGFANMVFAPKNALLVEFFNPRYVNPCFWRIACAVGARHAYFLGEPDSKKSRLADATGHIFLSETTLRELDDFLTHELA